MSPEWEVPITTDCMHKKSNFGKKYNGTAAITFRGKKCLDWADSAKGTSRENEPSNYCRNPDPITSGNVWCHVQPYFDEDFGRERDREWCPIPECRLTKNDFKKYISKTVCPQNYIQQNGEDSKHMQSLPVVDLFLNPDREDELRQMQQRMEDNERHMTYTEVSTES